MSLSVNESKPAVVPQSTTAAPAAAPTAAPAPAQAPSTPSNWSYQTRFQSDGFDAPKAKPKVVLAETMDGGVSSFSRAQAQSDYDAILRDGTPQRLGMDTTNLLAQHRGDTEYASALVSLLQQNGQLDSVVEQTFGHREGDGLGEWRHPILTEAIDAARTKGGLLDEEIAAYGLGYNGDAWKRMNELSASPIPHVGVPAETWLDGQLIDGTGQAWPPGTPLTDIPAVYPQDGNANGLIIQVNGVGGDLESQMRAMQTTADTTGKAVIGIHNGTDGRFTDVLQSVGDKAAWSNNPATQTLTQTVIAELEAGKGVHICAHSQGALITSAALRGVVDYYEQQGMSSDEIEAKLSNLEVETFGGAACSYPDGPKYVHYVNTKDVVPMAFGLGSHEQSDFFNMRLGSTAAPVDPGKNAKIVWFSQDYPGSFGLGPHDYNNVYLPRRRDFDTVYYGG